MGQNDSQLNRDFSQSKSAWEFRKLRQVSISYPNDIQTHAEVTVIVGILVLTNQNLTSRLLSSGRSDGRQIRAKIPANENTFGALA